ncbi:DUF6922 domain-containing protein [Petrimonas sp.]|uniref:DUF6922 domain-containing protein n=1 Tax=Petrimonas sp. TaxID=2023866 RepID=UPI003F514986
MKPVFEKRIFWDVDFESIDYDKSAKFVIQRVFERGDVSDIRECRRYYGIEKITKILLNVRYLPEKTLYLAAALLNKDLNEFKCYSLRQSNPELYPY